MKRKFLALILAALCAATSSVCFAACNTNDDGKGSDKTGNNQPEITELQEYDLSGISFNDKSVTYDGNFHSIEIVGDLPQGVSVSYTGGGTDAGEYTVTAKFAGDTVTHKPIADITAKLTITKAPFMGVISFSGAQFDYDGEAHNITLTGDLPEGIFVSYEYKNEAGETVAPENVKEIGEYTVTAVFTSENYQPISSLTAVLKIVGESLYDESGNLNYAVFANTIKDWMNDGYYLDKISVVNSAELKTVDYVALDKENNLLSFGAYMSVDGVDGGYQNFQIASNDLYETIINGVYRNVAEFTTYLNSLPGKPVIKNGGITAYDTTITQSNLHTMAENILTRLKEVGCQSSSIRDEGIKVNDYVGANILSVRKDKDMGGTSAYDMGTIYTSNFYIIVEKTKGVVENLALRLVYKTDKASQNIIDNQEDSWLIRDYKSKEIDYCPYA